VTAGGGSGCGGGGAGGHLLFVFVFVMGAERVLTWVRINRVPGTWFVRRRKVSHILVGGLLG
jgi:hypothetical protein